MSHAAQEKGARHKKRHEEAEGYTYKTLIFELFKTYDPLYLRFGDFSFYNDISQSKGLFIFAGSSSSYLTFKNSDSKVIEYDRDEWAFLNYCAKNTTAFLQALLPMFEMYSLRFQKIIDSDDEKINNEYLEKCVQAAGGSKYKRFYKNIIG
jgi:hypothetical protein